MSKEEKKRVSKPKNRKSVLFFLFFTTFISLFLYYQGRFDQLWQNIFKTKTYEFVAQQTGKQTKVSLNLETKKELTNKLYQLVEENEGEYGIYFHHPEAEETWSYQKEKTFTAASVNKIFIIAAFLEQVEKTELALDDFYILKEKDIQKYGSGSLQYQEPGKKYTYQELINLTGKESDNTAARVLQNKIGIKKVKEHLRAQGLEKTSLEENTTIPGEIGKYLVALYQGEILSSEHREFLFSSLTNTDFEERIPKGVPRNIQVVHKIGNGPRVYNDCGIVFGDQPFIVCFFSQEAPKEEAFQFIQTATQLFWSFVNQN